MDYEGLFGDCQMIMLRDPWKKWRGVIILRFRVQLIHDADHINS
jgi:hypothetical protein